MIILMIAGEAGHLRKMALGSVAALPRVVSRTPLFMGCLADTRAAAGVDGSPPEPRRMRFTEPSSHWP